MSSALVQTSGSAVLDGGSSAAAIINSAVASSKTLATTTLPAISQAYAAPAVVETVTAPAPVVPSLPLDQYQLNVDPNPTVIRKKPAEKVKYTQQVSLKFLKPPPPEQPGDIIIKQEPDVQAPPGLCSIHQKLF